MTITKHGEVIPITVTNPKMSVKVEVTKRGFQKPLSNVTFHICKKDGTFVDEFTTDITGKGYSAEYTAEELGEGAYIKEVGVVPGYEPYTKHHVIQFKTDSTERVQMVSETVTNELEPVDLKLRKVNKKGESVAAQFNVSYYIYNYRAGGGSYIWAGGKTIETTKDKNVCSLKDLIRDINTTISSDPFYATDEYVKIRFTETKTEDPYLLNNDTLELHYWPDSGKVLIGSPAMYYTFDEKTLTLTCQNNLIPISIT